MTVYDTYMLTEKGMVNLATGRKWDPAKGYGFPWEGNTGFTADLEPYTGPQVITDPNFVLEGYDISGDVKFEETATNGTIRQCRIRSNGFWPCRMLGGGVIEDSEIIGGDGSQASLLCVDTLCTRLNLHGAGDGIRLGRSSLIDSYVHDLADFDGAHVDAVEIIGELGGPNRITGNTILNRVGQTSAIMMSSWGHNPDVDTIVEGNLIAGGGYSIYGHTPDTDIIGGLQVINNFFSTVFFPNSGQYSPVNVWPGAPNVWMNNLWIDGPNEGNGVFIV